MDIFSSFGQISFVAFIVIFGFLLYELLQLKKERQQKSKPSVPQFNQVTPTAANTPLKAPIPEVKLSTNKFQIPLIAILSIACAAVAIYILFSVLSPKPQPVQKAGIDIEEVRSAGIKIFTSEWKELKGKDIATIKTGDKLIIGIETVKNADIDEARIRVNESIWKPEHITKQLNPSYNVYYKEYTVPEGFIELNIDAQLHSVSQGWLTE